MKEIREQYEMNQEQLAKALDVSQTYISKLENEIKVPSVNYLKRFKSFFMMDIAESEMEAKIDYLRVRFKSHDVEEVIRKVLRMKPEEFGIEDHGFYRYSQTWYYSAINVYVHPENEDMGILIELTGQGCRQFEVFLEKQGRTWVNFFNQIYRSDLFDREIDVKVTRLDIAIDEKIQDGKENYNLLELHERYKQGLVEMKFQREQLIDGSKYSRKDGISQDGVSIYFGSRQSQMFFNFYEKDYELAQKEGISLEESRKLFGVKNRYEIRLADEKAEQVLQYIRGGYNLGQIAKRLIDTSIQVYSPQEDTYTRMPDMNWRKLIESMEPLKLSVSPQKPDFRKTMRWLEQQLSPSLKMIQTIGKQFDLNLLEDEINHAELKEKHQKIIQFVLDNPEEVIEYLEEKETEMI
jgi:phage replication initiation protein